MIIQNDDELQKALSEIKGYLTTIYLKNMVDSHNYGEVELNFISAIRNCWLREASNVLAIYKYHLQTISYATERQETEF